MLELYVCMYSLSIFKEYSFFRMSVSPYDKIQHESSTKYFPIIFMENESFKSNCSIKNFYIDSNYLAIVISKSTRNTHKMWLVFFLLDIVVASPESFAPSLGNYIDFHLASQTSPRYPRALEKLALPLPLKGWHIL